MSSINYTLYYGEYSLCSMMVRLTVRLRGPHKSNLPTHFAEKHINIIGKENITESYLLTVNRKGQVPALTSPSLPEPIADSLLITKYMAETYPSLFPEEHKEDIVNGLERLHELNYYSLSYAGTNQFTKWLQEELEEILKGEISEEYRGAIEYKKGVYVPPTTSPTLPYIDISLRNIEHEYVNGLKQDTVEEMVEKARLVLLDFSKLLPAGGKWLFGVETPTALDAHLIPFLVRLEDVKREVLIPENLMRYVEEKMEMEEWRDMMQGRSTYSPAESVGSGRT